MHTKGKLTISPDLRWIIGSDGNRVGSTGGALTRSLDQNEANARRLVACWNYCDPVETEDLELTDYGKDADRSLALVRLAEEREKKMRNQRDELVNVLRKADAAAFFDEELDDEITAILAKYPQS